MSDGIFFNLFLNLFVFFLEKSYHSNSAITFILDPVRSNGFHYNIDQARNFPFGLPDDRWRHDRLRNGLLYNHLNFQISAPFFKKGMNRRRITIPPKSPLISFVWDRLPFLIISIAQLILEKYFHQNSGFFYDFFACFSP